MKFLAVALLSILLFASTTRGQDTTTAPASSTRFERIVYVTGATLALSLFDYVGFNFARSNFNTNYGHPALTIYHSILFGVGAALNYFLYEKLGLSSAIAFDLMWWSWIDDFGFYGWSNALNVAAPWGNRSNAYFNDNTCCASWTPVGLMRAHNEYLPTNALIGQAFTGFTISMAIIW